MCKYFTILILLILLISSCREKEEKAQQTVGEFDFPELLDRHPRLQHGEEWDHIQNQYGRFCREALAEQEAGEAYLNLAQVFINEARITGEHGHYYPAALKMLNAILRQDSLDRDLQFRAMATQAGVSLSLHNFKEALETGQKALNINPYNAGIYGVMVDACVELGRYGKAVEMADKMVSIRPDLRSYSRVSYLREIHGDVNGAVEAMEMAVAAGYPGYEQTAWARLTLGNLHRQYGSFEEARQQYLLILQERPGYPFALAALAAVEAAEGHFAEAEQKLKEACEIIPEVGFYMQLAEIYQKTGRTELQQSVTRDILKMLADDEAHGHRMTLEYAHVYADLLEDNDKALEYAMKAYEERPENIEVNRMLAKVYFGMGQTQKAKKHLEAASRTNMKDPELLELKAELAVL